MKFGRKLGTAADANPTKSCDRAVFCQLEANGFPGGTLSIDADALNGPNKLALLRVKTEAGQRCATEFRADPPRSWVCRYMSPGKIRVITSEAHVNTYDYRVGARW